MNIRTRIDAITKTLYDIDNRLIKAINKNPNEEYIKQILPRHNNAMATLCEIEDLYFEDCLTFGEVEELALQAGALAVDITMLEIILEKGEN